MSEEDQMHSAAIKWKQALVLGTVMVVVSISMLFLSLIFLSLLFIFMITEIILLVLGAQIFFTGLVGREFQGVVKRLRAHDVHLDMLRMVVRFSFDSTIFNILYHQSSTPYGYWILRTHGLRGWEAPPDHIQVWTVTSWPVSVHEDPYVLAKELRRPGKIHVLFQLYSEPPDNPFSEDLKEYHPLSVNIPSLYYIGLTKRRTITRYGL